MSFELSEKVLRYLQDAEKETIELIEELCKIPAPSGKEEQRADFCKKWLEKNNAEGVYIDSALNVIYPINCEGRNDIVVFMAHTDTVFPDTEPMPFSKDEEYMYAPGVGDDTTGLAMIMMIAKYIATEKIKPSCGMLIVANSCEEGLGDLKGTKQLMADFGGRIKEVYSFDGKYDGFVNKYVGSHRYEITFETEGGHSFGAFGNRSAVFAMAQLICKLHECEVPVLGESKTTYNVGIVEGGTSVNTIPQSAKMLYEYRSDSVECLEKMKEFFEEKIQEAKEENLATITVKLVGNRPCSGVIDSVHLGEMGEKVKRICEKHSNTDCRAHSASTDGNVPMAMGIPAITAGNYIGCGAHTREEKVLLKSIPVGLKITAELMLGYFAD